MHTKPTTDYRQPKSTGSKRSTASISPLQASYMSRHNFGVKHTHLNIHAPTFTYQTSPQVYILSCIATTSTPSPQKIKKETLSKRSVHPLVCLLAYLLIISPILSLKYYMHVCIHTGRSWRPNGNTPTAGHGEYTNSPSPISPPIANNISPLLSPIE